MTDPSRVPAASPPAPVAVPSWQAGRFRIDLSRPRVMGIVNVTPDSFSDGGLFAEADAARAHCERLVAAGADILDIGGESTRPGARLPDTAEQLARVLPVLRHALTLGVPVSVAELSSDLVNEYSTWNERPDE